MKKLKKFIAWCFATLPRKIISSLVITGILLSSLWFLFLRPQPVEAGWFDEDWLYRRSIAITNNTTAETNVYVAVTIDTSDTTKFQTDCGDLRFTKLNGVLLKYYISSGCGTASTVAHILFDTFPAGAQTIYYYYGNPSAENGFEGTGFSTLASNYTVGSIGSEEKGVGPVLWLKMDEGYGTTAYDSTEQDNDFTLSAESWTTDGKFSRAWDGDGSKYVYRANDDDFNFTAATDFSISGWFKSDSATNPGSNEFLINKATSSAGYAVYMDTSGDVVFGIDDDSTWNPDDDVGNIGSDYYDNTWHHFTAIKTGTTKIEIFVDGVLIGSNSSLTATSTLVNSALLYIGDSDGTDNGDEFNGDIDEVKIFRFALSADEVKVEYNRAKAIQLGGDTSQAEAYCPPGFTGTCTPPVGEWKMDEYSGSTAFDTSANINNGTLVDNTTWKSAADCKYGSCLSFDGDGDSVIGTTLTQINSPPYTVCAWFNTKDIITNHLIFALQTDSVNWALVRISSDDLLLGIRAGGSSVYTTKADIISANTWYHVCGVFAADDNRILYFNGVNVSNSSTNVDYNPTGTYKIGVIDTTAYPFNGLIDNVMIFNRALTQSEISWIYNRGKPVGHWKFDEGEGSTAKDSSENNLSGTISGATWSTSGKYNSTLDFDGTDDVVTVTQNSIINATSKVGYAMSAWVYPHTSGESDSIGGQFISKGTNTYLRVDTSSGGRVNVSASLGLATPATLTISSAIPLNQWSHIEMTYSDDDDDEITLYINGVNMGSSTNGVGSPATDSNNLLIGGSTSANFDGLIDEVKIYNYEPTAEQVKIDYNQGAAIRFGD